MQVRDARPEDAVGIARLSVELGEVLRNVGNPVGAALSEAAVRQDAFGPKPVVGILVAELDGSIAGYLLHHPSYDPDLGGRVTTVVDLFVSRTVRRRGIGRALMDAALDRSRRNGEQALVWRVRPTNQSALRFYESLGASMGSGPVSMHLPVARDPKDAHD